MRLLIWFDAIGLSLFTVLGAQKTIELGAPYPVAILMGVMSATFGGIMRDVVCNDIPVMLRKEIYISAALCGAIVFVAGHHWWGPSLLLTLLAFSTTLFARALGIVFKLQLPIRKSD